MIRHTQCICHSGPMVLEDFASVKVCETISTSGRLGLTLNEKSSPFCVIYRT